MEIIYIQNSQIENMRMCNFLQIVFKLQNSVSPGDRDKYRSRSPTEIDPVVKRRKDDKLGHVSLSNILQNPK